MKKLLLLGALLASTAMQAQNTYYWPGERVSELISGNKYFIYNTAVDGDRSWFLYSNGNTLKTNNVSPKEFITSDDSYLFTTTKPETPTDASHWYLQSKHGNVGIGGQTNNQDIRNIYINYWYGNETITKGGAKSEDEEGTAQNPNTTDTHVFAITSKNAKYGNGDTNYAWNGDQTEAGLGSGWVTYKAAHPYAFYTVESKKLSDEAFTYYNEVSARNGLFADFAFLLQQRYGLVQNGDKYYSNYKSTQEGSYEALIDGNDGSYFHSAYGNEAGSDSDPKHYLRAQILNPTTSFYIITKRRCDNNNNRPTSILVEGSDDTETNYANIITLQGLPTDANEYFYFSDKITASTAYNYLRFTPQTINTGTRFFTYSEFYIIPSTTATDKAMKDIKALYNIRNIKDETVTDELLTTAGNSVQEDYKKLLYESAKEDANNLISANISNHAADPQLGQYPTEAYNALQSAINTASTSEELENAIKTFKFSINAPVFTINGAYSGDYKTVGNSIYYKAGDDTPLWWNKATNKYDKTMLWKFANLTTETPETGATYSLMNLSKNVYLWGIENVQITETNPTNTDGIILLKTEGYANPIHADRSGKIVRWNNTNPNSASAWTIEYVGESKIIEKISEEEIEAAAGLNTLITECESYSDKIGSGLNQFTCNGHDFETALSNAKTALTNLYSDPNIDVITAYNELRSAKEALVINQPEPGKFYRIKGASGKYISSEAISTTVQNVTTNKLKMSDAKDNSTVLFLSEGNRITTEKMQNMSRAGVHLNGLGSKYTFTAHQTAIGKYVITPSESPEGEIGGTTNNPLYDFSGTSGAVDQVQNANDANCAWTLEEVTETAQQPNLNQTIGSTGYATLAAPVALNIPSGVKAYTVTVSNDQTKANLNEIKGSTIPAGCGVVLKAESPITESENFKFTLNSGTDAPEINENALVPLYTETTIGTDITAYILANINGQIGFYLLDPDEANRTVGANKAYLVLPQGTNAVRSILFGGPTTGIENTVATDSEKEEYYDLQGRRVMNPEKGIYITKSGKKVIFTK